MKTSKLIKQGIFFTFLICGLLIIHGCKKDKKQKEQELDSIIGSWMNPQTTESIFQTVHFMSDGTFSSTTTFNSENPATVSTTSGTFKTKGDSLFVAIKELSERKGNKTPVKTTVNYKLYDNATFDVTNSILTLRYTTYPADAPVATEVKFQRQLPD
ncbi:hypothetical protein [Mucilaginibacter aquaedulcis]|uniref:hypothetical protein n=1 Tax=Mucilaginibacter aquaedulcis TaxID=1187081 RepID=UPI0025B61CA4|nr:hypothetical protein [Mucilaginibacter aquaedulcis]MDN3547691.1 hypothetical protein [Mucilaginibacter aquaedulcis]